MTAEIRVQLFILFALAFPGVSNAAERVNASRIQARFIAPCCWHENLAVHNSPVAEQMRAEIEQMVLQGQTEDQIVDRYVSRYGEKILGEPRGRIFWTLTIVPLIAIAAASIALGEFIRRRATHRQSLPATVIGALPDVDFD